MSELEFIRDSKARDIKYRDATIGGDHKTKKITG